MKDCYGQHGWREFYQNRLDILHEFDRLVDITSNRPVKTSHGTGIEAYLRKWLSDFLPKKFGVTSGYVISTVGMEQTQHYHYDIIIYDALNAPTLWIEGNEDMNAQGKYRAIQAKHILAVYEVKSRINKKNIQMSLEKLCQLSKYKDQLNNNYFCGSIYIDLKKKDVNDESVIKELYKGKDVYGYYGGMILRYEGDNTCTGLINLGNLDKFEAAESGHYKPIAKPIDDLKILFTEEGQIKLAEQGSGAMLVHTSKNTWSVSKSYGVMFNKQNHSSRITWSRNNFTEFCINLLNNLEGLPYNSPERQAFGRIFESIEPKGTILQGELAESGKPFLEFSIENKDPDVKIIDGVMHIAFEISIKNSGTVEAILSDDFFKTQCKIPPGKTAKRMESYSVQGANGKIKKSLLNNVSIPYRFVYKMEGDDSYTAIIKKVKIRKGKIII